MRRRSSTRRGHRAPLSSLAPALLAAFGLAGCGKDPLTQIVVAVDSDWDGFDRMRIEVEGFQEPVAVRADLDDSELPRRFAIVHEGGPLGPIAVTVSAYVAGIDQPVLVEPRSDIFFVRGQTKLLKIDLFFACIGACDEGEACAAGGECLSSARAGVLVDWEGDVGALPKSSGRVQEIDGAIVPVPADGNMPALGDGGVTPPLEGGAPEGGASDGGMESGTGGAGGAGGTGGTEAGTDSGPPLGSAFDYAPSNVDLAGIAMSATRAVFGCGTTEFDSTNLTFSGSCGSDPEAVVITQIGGGEAAALVMGTLTIESDSRLRLRGSRPVIFVVYGDVSIDGELEASASGAERGPGVSASCATGAGSDGGSAPLGGGGGGGGGFGGNGGGGGVGMTAVPAVSGGSPVGNSTLTPLRAGCSGGRGGVGVGGAPAPAGGGGGAVQLSVAGMLAVRGNITAAGGGGQPGGDRSDGGGGGGSGGAILLEAGLFMIDNGAGFAANGGGGGGGYPTTSSGSSSAGADGRPDDTPASGGAGDGAGGDGGNGAALASAAVSGMNGTYSVLSTWGGGGGGGGGVGRIRVNRAGTCMLPGLWSPAPSCP